MKRIYVAVAIVFIGSSLVAIWMSLDQISEKSYRLEPDEVDFSGIWTFFSKETGLPIMTSEYENGRRNGKTIAWECFPTIMISETEYINGTIHGLLRRYDRTESNRIVVEGEFVDGKAWNGFFICTLDGDIIVLPFLDLGMRDFSWSVVHFINGEKGCVSELGGRSLTLEQETNPTADDHP